MNVKLKICGITNLDDALYCADAGADALGFVIYEKSQRNISIQKAAEIIKNLPPFVVAVAVTVNPDDRQARMIKDAGFDVVQIHGTDNIKKTDIRKIAAIPFEKLKNYNSKNDYILVDSAAIGGTGKSFDWSVLNGVSPDKIIVSGGLNQQNITELLRKYKPYAVDLSSSLEQSPGKKDHAKVKSFIHLLSRLTD